MKRFSLLFVFLLCAAVFSTAQNTWSFKGTVIKMQMADCLAPTGFRAAVSGSIRAIGSCPQYTVLSSNVVYVVVGQRADEFMPLAENMDFTIRKNKVLAFAGDENKPSRFVIQKMILRSEWELQKRRQLLDDQSKARSVRYEMGYPLRSEMIADRTR